MANGILIVNKPADWTSQDVVSKLRGVFREKRVGHGGTLDPMATGVLPVFFGRATRAVEFFEHADKKYVATVRLGLITDTQDTTGNILETRDVCVTEEKMQQVITKFVGKIEQIPPMYSAIKIGGKKLYELARAGKEVERKPRQIEIFSLEAEHLQDNDWKLTVHCSKGTYIRTLCHDIGLALGCGACMASLKRTAAGVYTLEQSVGVEELVNDEERSKQLLPVDSLFEKYPAIVMTKAQEKCIRNGAAFTYKGTEGMFRIYSEEGEFLALARVMEGRLSTVKSFFGV